MENKPSWIREIVKPIVFLGAISLSMVSFAEEKSQEFSHEIETVLAPTGEKEDLEKDFEKREKEFIKDRNNVYKDLSQDEKEILFSLYSPYYQYLDSIDKQNNIIVDSRVERSKFSSTNTAHRQERGETYVKEQAAKDKQEYYREKQQDILEALALKLSEIMPSIFGEDGKYLKLINFIKEAAERHNQEMIDQGTAWRSIDWENIEELPPSFLSMIIKGSKSKLSKTISKSLSK